MTDFFSRFSLLILASARQANNAAYQSLVQLLRSEITELHARFDPKITQLESHLTSTPPNPPTYFYASRLRERLSKAVQDCTNAIRIYEEMIQSAYRAQANIMAIQQDANNYTTNTIREVNANRQRAFEVGNQKWSNVFNCEFDGKNGGYERERELTFFSDCRWR